MNHWLILLLFLAAGVALGYAIAHMRARLKALNPDAVHPLIARIDAERLNAVNERNAEADKKIEALKELAAAREANKALTEKLENQVEELQQMRKQLNLEFENLANRIFEAKSEKFKQENKDQLAQVLNPLQEKLKDFEVKVDKVHSEEVRERISLKKELETLNNLNQKLSTEAKELTTALKGDNKTQGNWGELVLEKVLERSGLREGVEYRVQYHTQNQEGDRIQPDVVVMLPDDKHIIIDSKVSLVAYTALVAAEDEISRNRLLQQHIASVKQHIKVLGEKKYTTASDLHTPDFVLLFMPIEGAFSAALQTDTDLYAYAWERNIVIVSPTTLLATLRTVSSIWKQERQTRNIQLIAEEGAKLYDKFVGFTEDLLELGRKMDSSKKSYEEAMKKLAEGRGNLVSKVEKLKELGLSNTKMLNTALQERALRGEPHNEDKLFES